MTPPAPGADRGPGAQGVPSAVPGGSRDPAAGLPRSIATERLELVSLSISVLTAVASGDRSVAERELEAAIPATWLSEQEHLARHWAQRLRENPARAPYMARALVFVGPPRTVVGHAGFHGPPDAGCAVEVGYTVEPDFRRRGFAEEAVRALAQGAFMAGVQTIRASISPENAASRRLVGKVGLHEVGSQLDAVDGHELVFEATLPLDG